MTKFHTEGGQLHQTVSGYPRRIIDAVQPELPRMAVVPYSSDVLCVHKTRLQLMYTDVQQLKMVQMVSQPLYFAILIYICLMRLPC